MLRDNSVTCRYWECDSYVKRQSHNQLVLNATDFPGTSFVVTLCPGLYFVERLRDAIFRSIQDDLPVPVLADFGLSKWMAVVVMMPAALIPITPLLIPVILAGVNARIALSTSIPAFVRTILVCLIDILVVAPTIVIYLFHSIQ